MRTTGEAWARCNTETQYESIKELLSAHTDLQVGSWIVRIEWENAEPGDFFSLEDFLGRIESRMRQRCHCFTEAFPSIPASAMLKLEGFLTEWVKEQMKPNYRTTLQRRVYTLTEKDFKCLT